ncbi:DNA translocase FtsK 4TM domain-containing protein [candidate division KSB1 bacterium]|nr:DNA translocase FtsK 4TM domain-containing protein [candidate division KSB1 bacterium]
MSAKKKIRIIGILLVSLGVFIFLSLLFFIMNPAPVEIIEVSNHTMGFVGGWISRALFENTIGYACFIFPLLVFLWGINITLSNKIVSLKKITGYALLLSLYTSIGIALIEIIKNTALTSGLEEVIPIKFLDERWGAVGGFFGKHIFKLVGTAGSIIFFPTIVLATLLLAIDVKFGKIKGKLMRWGTIAVAFIFRKYDRRDFKPNHPLPSLKSLLFPAKEKKEKKKDFPAIKLPQTEPEITTLKEPYPDEQGYDSTDWINGKNQQTSSPDNEFDKLPKSRVSKKYVYPDPAILDSPGEVEDEVSWDELMSSAKTLEERLAEFGIQGKVIEINPGPVITRFEIEPAPGIKISRFTSLSDDLALVMRAKRIRVVAPIPGKAAIGIEIPNRKSSVVLLKPVIDSARFKKSKSPLSLALGKTIDGEIYVGDLASMPHLLVAGSTGSGKSVCLNTIIASILYKANPDQVQLVMIDPKRLELNVYSALKHHHLAFRNDLPEEVVTNPANAVSILRSLELEMERRYELLAKAGVRNIDDYNKWVKSEARVSEENNDLKPLHYIVLIIDELADLMLTAARDVEEPIARLTQMSRAVGIHLIVATQRPSVDVITGVIKANFPARMAFQVASKTDSRTILDQNGAEKLLGKGDMIFLPPSSPEAVRIHGAFISHDEVKRIIQHVRQQPIQDPKFMLPTENDDIPGNSNRYATEEQDDLFNEALKLVVRHQQGSVSLLQRRLKIGYARAGRLMDQLEDAGYVGPFDGSKAREVLIDEEELIATGLF